MSHEEKFEALMRNYEAATSANEELKNRNEYMPKQLGGNMKHKQKALESPTGSVYGDEETSNTTSEEEPPRRIRRRPHNSNDFEVKIPEFEGRLDPEEFLH